MHQSELYDDVPCAFGHCSDTSGDPLTLTLGEELTGVDFLLSRCPHASFRDLTGFVNAPNAWSACEVITARSMPLEAGADVHLTAGRLLVLGDGFVVEAGASLRVEIDPALSGRDP